MPILIIVSIVIFLIVIILLSDPKTNKKTNIWYAAFLVSASMGYTLVVLKAHIIPATYNNFFILISYFLAAVSYRFSPYFLLIAGMSYANFINATWKNILKYFTLIPCLVTFVLDLNFPSRGFNISIFWTVSIWTIPYGILGVLFFIHAYFIELDSKRKKFKLFVSLINLPVLGNIFLLYGTNAFKINDCNMWIISLIPAIAVVYVFVFYAYKRGIFGSKTKLEPEEEKKIFSLLTEAEKEVALLKLQGKTNQAIAEIRNVSIATVKSQINDIYRKLHIKTIDELKDKKLNH